MIHPWHDIPLGDNAPEEVRAVIEVPGGDTTKYELDPELGLISVNRVLHPPIPYPTNYGFLPQTLDDDGDPFGRARYDAKPRDAPQRATRSAHRYLQDDR